MQFDKELKEKIKLSKSRDNSAGFSVLGCSHDLKYMKIRGSHNLKYKKVRGSH